MTNRSSSRMSGGLAMALGAYVIWGLLPLYMRQVHVVPPMEFLAWRIIFTLPVCLVLVAIARQGAELLAAVTSRKALLALCLSAICIGLNWLVYVSAVHAGHIFATSMGYYINPLVNVLVGTLFLRERLSPLQWLAVALAAGGVGFMAWGAREMLGISLVLAFSFSSYGLVRKLAPVGALPGLTIETAVLLLPAIAYAASCVASPQGAAMTQNLSTGGLVSLSGVLTAVPLLLFAGAARRMDYSTLGFVQFLSPTIVFLMGLFVFHEPLRPSQLWSFLAIWGAIAVFCWDMWARSRRDSAAA